MPAVGEVVEQLAALELPLHRGAREVVHDGGELAEVAEQQELDFAVHGDVGDVVPQPRVELRDLFRHQPVDVAVPVPDGAPRPVVGRLLLHAEVLHGGVGLRDDLDLVPFFPEGGHDLARQVGFPGARIARQQQASAFEAVEHGVFRDLPVHRAAVRTLGLDSGDPVLALEALDLWKTTQSVFTAFRYLDGTAASASRRAWRTSPRPRRAGAGRSPGARPPGASRRSGPPGAPRGLAPCCPWGRRWVPGTCCGPGRSCGTGPRLFRSRSAPACGC